MAGRRWDTPNGPLRALLLTGLMLALALAGATPAAVAQDDRATVRIDGRALFRVGSTGETGAEERARQVERRIATLLASPDAIGPARVETTGTEDERVVTVSGVPVVTVTEGDADDNLTTVDALAGQWANALDAGLRRAAERRLSWGGRFLTEIQGAIETAFARFVESLIATVPRFLAASLVVALFWGIATAVRRLMRLIFRRVVEDLTVESLIKQLVYYAVWAVGLFVALDALGFDPQTVVAGLGLTGLALGFALKDILSNFVSGVLILALRPFQLGDQIVVGETEGGVVRIDLRATQIRTYDGRLVLVPNGEVFTSRVTNNTASPVRRGTIEVSLGYDTDLDAALRAMAEATRHAPGVLADPPPSVRLGDLGSDDILVEVGFWTDSRRSDFVATSSAVRRAIVDALRATGVPLPDPAVRTLTWLAGSANADRAARQPRSVHEGTAPRPDRPAG